MERLQWRRNKVLELSSQGRSQPQIARILQVGLGTVNRDLQFLRKEAKENIKKYVDEKLPEEYEKTLCGLNSILREAWTISQATETGRMEKIKALNLAKDCYSMKLELLTNATVVNDAIRFVHSYQTYRKSSGLHHDPVESIKEASRTKHQEEDDGTSSPTDAEVVTFNKIF